MCAVVLCALELVDWLGKVFYAVQGYMDCRLRCLKVASVCVQRHNSSFIPYQFQSQYFYLL